MTDQQQQPPPESVWLDVGDLLRLTCHPHIAQGIVAAIDPDEQSLKTMSPCAQYVRADLVEALIQTVTCQTKPFSEIRKELKSR